MAYPQTPSPPQIPARTPPPPSPNYPPLEYSSSQSHIRKALTSGPLATFILIDAISILLCTILASTLLIIDSQILHNGFLAQGVLILSPAPLAIGITLLVCSRRIRRGSLNAVVTALVMAILALLFLIATWLAFILVPGAPGPAPDNSTHPVLAIAEALLTGLLVFIIFSEGCITFLLALILRSTRL